jgi:hypothetical protein
MNNKILGFKIFHTELDFIDWQKETPREVFQVSPLVFSLGADISKNGSVDAVAKAGCFVLYEYQA